MSTKVDDLIARGAQQLSRKYRRVFVAPAPSCLLWLKEHRPKVYDHIVEDALRRAESEAISFAYHDDRNAVELTSEEFAEFREKTTGKVPWSPEGKEMCNGCGSLGHMHRRGCVNEVEV